MSKTQATASFVLWTCGSDPEWYVMAVIYLLTVVETAHEGAGQLRGG